MRTENRNLFEFVETSLFTRFRENYLDDDELSQLQYFLSANPEVGDMVPGAGGVRKLRWRDSRRVKGKRGGLRVLYYCFLSDHEIWLMNLYDKNETTDLTKDEKDRLRQILEAERVRRRTRSHR